MLKPILDNLTKEKILLSILVRNEVYARDVASNFNIHLLSVQNQLKKLEKGGVAASQKKGRTRLYSFNPRYPFLKELKTLLLRALQFMPKGEKEKFYTPRLRPRRAGKPL
jgi:DNA-binding transcriptional ArsR family regulator